MYCQEKMILFKDNKLFVPCEEWYEENGMTPLNYIGTLFPFYYDGRLICAEIERMIIIIDKFVIYVKVLYDSGNLEEIE